MAGEAVRRAMGALLLITIMASCGGTQRVTGVVVAVDGGLTEVRSFSVRTEEGDALRFVPASEARFDGGPLSHLRDHLRTGEPVVVTYRSGDEGTLVAVVVEDA